MIATREQSLINIQTRLIHETYRHRVSRPMELIRIFPFISELEVPQMHRDNELIEEVAQLMRRCKSDFDKFWKDTTLTDFRKEEGLILLKNQIISHNERIEKGELAQVNRQAGEFINEFKHDRAKREIIAQNRKWTDVANMYLNNKPEFI